MIIFFYVLEFLEGNISFEQLYTSKQWRNVVHFHRATAAELANCHFKVVHWSSWKWTSKLLEIFGRSIFHWYYAHQSPLVLLRMVLEMLRHHSRNCIMFWKLSVTFVPQNVYFTYATNGNLHMFPNIENSKSTWTRRGEFITHNYLDRRYLLCIPSRIAIYLTKLHVFPVHFLKSRNMFVGL